MMRHNKIFTALTIVCALAIAAVAQDRFVKVYENGVEQSYDATTVDSMKIENSMLNIYNKGKVDNSFNITDIDSLKVVSLLDAPTNVHGYINGENINVTWSGVDQTLYYEVYRSGDGNNYNLLGQATGTSYTDPLPLLGNNYYKVRAIGKNFITNQSTSTGKIYFQSNVESGLYMGIIGFNQKLYNRDIDILNTETESNFTNYVNGLTAQNGTLLYYAVDNAIDKLVNATLPHDIINVAIVTFTDGLDQGSIMMNSNYSSDEEYLSSISKRIGNTNVKGKKIDAYSIGLRGDDVSDIEKFKENLQGLASSTEKAFEVNNMNEVNAIFQEIASKLYNESISQSISLTIPGQSDGTKIRFTFDNVTDAANSDLYIEGTFSLSDLSLKNITYKGFTSSSSSTVKGKQDGIFVTFTFEDIIRPSGETLPTNHIQQWSYITSTSKWQVNSEFTPDENTITTVEQKSAAIMLVLDCSSSLGNQFSTMQNSAKSFINTLVYGTTAAIYGNKFDIFSTISYDDMIFVKGGTFKMGAQSTDADAANYDSDANSDESPVHSVTLSSYYIGKYEVTQQLWEYVMNYTGTAADGSNMTAVTDGPWLNGGPSSEWGIGNTYPAYGINYNDITKYFIPRLNKISGKTFRLPTEAEWEYAARGGNKSNGYKYSGSNAIGDVAWYSENSNSTNHKVGTKQPNELGIYDMSGSVWEFCRDWYSSDYNYYSTLSHNPTGITVGSERVARGGCFYHNNKNCRISCRNHMLPSDLYSNVGFRLVLSETNKDYILEPSKHQTGNYTSFSSGIYTINSKYDIPIIIDNGPTKYFNDISTVYSHYISTPPGSTIEFNAPEAGILTICVLPTERTNDPNYPSFAPNVVYIKVTQDQGEEVKIGDFSTSNDYSYNDGGVRINYTYTVKVPMAGKVTIMSENTYNTYDNFYYIEFRP